MVLLRLFLFSMVGLTGVGTLFRLFFYLFHQKGFAGLEPSQVMYGLAWGLRFDLAVAAILTLINLLLGAGILYGLRKRQWALAPLALTTTLLVSLQASDIMYYHDAGRHIGYELSDAATDFVSLLRTALTEYAPITACGVLVLCLALWGLWKTRHWASGKPAAPLGITKSVLAGLAMVAVMVISIRGGVSGLPMSPIFAYKIGNPALADVALSGSYSGLYYLARSSRKVRPIAIPEVEPPESRKQTLAGIYPEAFREESLDFRRVNVVVILLESWAATQLEGGGTDRPVTPFFNSLRERGIAADAMVAGGHRTTEGIFTTFCSYPNPLGQTLAKSQLTTYPYRSLTQSLADQGWETLFFQGSRKDTSGTGAFAQRLGFKESYGKEEITQRPWGTNQWGVYDQDLYSFALQKMKKANQPFLVGINTNTTHDTSLPSSVPAAFGMETAPQRQLSVLHFADQALEGFIKAYEADPDFGPTLFVLLADHTAGVTGSPLTQYLIPFTLFSTDGSVAPLRLGSLVSQRDVAPTVAELLGGHIPAFTGRSLLKKGPRTADYYHQGILGWVEGDHVVEINILGGGEVASYLRTDTLDGLKAVAPDATHRRMTREALAFARRSQDLLFAGRTPDFFDILKDTE